MLYLEQRLSQHLRPHLRRVLVVDAAPASAKMLSELLKELGAGEIIVEPTNEAAMGALKRHDPQIVFTEFSALGLDGVQLTRALRRSTLSCRMAPVIMVTASATAPAILAARNAGVHEFLRKPFTVKDLMRRIDAVSLKPRDWIEAVDYVGPDRRRFNSGEYAGRRKRRSDETAAPDDERIATALKILRSAINSVEAEPDQALRSMRAQADDLRKIAEKTSNAGLQSAVEVLQRRLAAASAGQPTLRAVAEAGAAKLWAFLPADAKLSVSKASAAKVA